MAKGKDSSEMVDEAGQAAPPKKKKLLLIIIAVVGLLVLVGGAVLGFLLMSGHEEDGEKAKAEAVEKKDEGPPIYEKMGTATVRLADMQSYLQVDATLKAASPEVQNKIKTHMPELRNELLRLMAGKTAEELSAPGGQQKLAEEIQAQFNQILGAKSPDEGVRTVLFESFIIQ